MREGELVGELKGAPLRCTLTGAKWTRPGLLVTGEAAGSTYSFTGEGIGKAMETGMLAADAVLAGRAKGWSDTQVRTAYEQSLTALKPKFDLYQRANRVNAYPWLADLLIWRAQRSPPPAAANERGAERNEQPRQPGQPQRVVSTLHRMNMSPHAHFVHCSPRGCSAPFGRPGGR